MKLLGRVVWFLLLGVFFVSSAFAGVSPQIINTDSRNSLSLNGYWKYIVDPYQTGYYDYRREPRDVQEQPANSESIFLGYKAQHPRERVEYDFDKSDNILVPRDWNTQKEKLFYYEGAVWYYKSFSYAAKANTRQFIWFGAANYKADVYLNGQKLGTHVGGFTPFNFEVTDKLRIGENFLIVQVDNTRGLAEVPTVNTDWWNYGGLTRDVKIIDLPETFIQDYYVQLAADDPAFVEVEVKLNGSEKAQREVCVSISGVKRQISGQTNQDGVMRARLKAGDLNLWSPSDPFLYDVKISFEGEELSDRIGFRTLQVEGSNILLNGESVFLRGISIHEENPVRGGRAYSIEDARLLLGWAKELGCNFVRLAHYPHNENMVRVADEMGLMVWSEVPVYWTIQWENEVTFKNAKAQVENMIVRDINRASVIIWSMANETPVSSVRTQFLKQLIETTRSMDPVRLVSAALERHTKEGTSNVQVVEDPLQEYVDVISFNQYLGWYSGIPEDLKSAVFDISFDKPVIVSEFGAGALQGYHGSKDELWTEEFQEYLYEETLGMLEKIPQLRGMTPWILADFRSPRRPLADIQDGWNRKGLISQTGNKKKAFFVLRDYYRNKEEQYK